MSPAPAMFSDPIGRAILAAGLNILTTRTPYKRSLGEELGGGLSAGLQGYDSAVRREMELKDKEQEMDLAKKLYDLKKSEHDFVMGKGKRIEDLFERPIGIKGPDREVSSNEFADYQPAGIENIISNQIIPGNDLKVKDAIASALKNPAYGELLPAFLKEGISVPNEWFKDTDSEKVFKNAIFSAIGQHLSGGGTFADIPAEMKKLTGMLPSEETVDDYGKYLRSRGLSHSAKNEADYLQFKKALSQYTGEGTATGNPRNIPVGMYSESKKSLVSLFLKDMGENIDDYMNPLTNEVSDVAITTNMKSDTRVKYERALELMDEYIQRGISPNRAALNAYKAVNGVKAPAPIASKEVNKSEIKPNKSSKSGKVFKSSTGREFNLPNDL